MGKKLTALLLPVACILIFSAGAGAGDRGNRQVTSVGCLQVGTEPNTFIFNSDRHGDLSRSGSAPTPVEMARVELSPIRVVPETNVNLHDYIGHRARAKGYLLIQKTATGSSPGQLEYRITSIHRIAGT